MCVSYDLLLDIYKLEHRGTEESLSNKKIYNYTIKSSNNSVNFLLKDGKITISILLKCFIVAMTYTVTNYNTLYDYIA